MVDKDLPSVSRCLRTHRLSLEDVDELSLAEGIPNGGVLGPFDKPSSDRQADLLTGTGYVQRPGFGTAGRQLQVQANMFKATFNGPRGQGLTINQYDVEITPVVKVANQTMPKPLVAKIWEQLGKDARAPAKAGIDAAAFDNQKIAWSPVKLCPDDGKLEVTIALAEKGQPQASEARRFKVKITFASLVDLDAIKDFCGAKPQSQAASEQMLTALQAMNVLFRQDPSVKYKPIGAQGKRFFGLEGAVPISDGGVVLNGFMQSFRFTQAGHPAVQLDTAYSAFVQPGLLPDVAAGLLGRSTGGASRGGRGGRGFDRGARGRGGLPSRGGPSGGSEGLQQLDKKEIQKLNKVLKSAKFQVTHRVFSIQKLTEESAESLSFLLNGRDGQSDRKVNVVAYYRDQYNITIRNPRLPCVVFGTKNYIPTELVQILDYNTIPMVHLTSDQTADMIRVAAKPPPQRAQMINQWRKTLNYESLPKLKAWAVEVHTRMMQVSARVLTPPEVLYRSGGTRAANGGWNLKGGVNKFIKAGRPLKSWGVVSFDRFTSVQDLQVFIPQLVRSLRANGIMVENATPALTQSNPDNTNMGRDGTNKNVQTGMLECIKAAYAQSKMDPQIIFAVEPRKITELKSEIKRVAVHGWPNKPPIVTQVLLATNIKKERGLDQYINNVTMKINLKLGGANHTVRHEGLDSKTMLIGADVTHPPARRGGPAGGPLPPSIAVSVAGVSGENTVFKPAIRLQEGRTEIIEDLEEVTFGQIKVFETNTKHKPDKILFYRDGVSEGQYAHCADIEFAAIKAACRRFGANYKPKVTFVICAKRHHMRFFAENDRDVDRTGNLPPGLVVDRGVTHPFAFDFYLQAHAGLQGTARPTHYVVIKDEIGYTADRLQGLTNALCYTFARATRSVSLVPPAYYADIIAGAARDLVYGDDSTTSHSGSGIDSSRLQQRLEDEQSFGKVAWYM